MLMIPLIMSQIKSKGWSVMINLKEVYFHIIAVTWDLFLSKAPNKGNDKVHKLVLNKSPFYRHY